MKYLLLLFLVSPLHAECQIRNVLPIIRPNAQWVQRGDDYEAIEWFDRTQIKPTQLEIQAAITACVSQKQAENQARTQAKVDLNTKSKTEAERIDAIITYLGLDK